MEMDRDLAARQEARELARQAETARKILADLEQKTLDGIVEAVAEAFFAAAGELAELAVEETGFGNVRDKIRKNRFASRNVAEAMRGMQAVGVWKEPAGGKLWEVGVPVGVIAAVVPSTNPTSTVCYKALIAIKSGNAIVFSPHPKALRCTLRAAELVAKAAEAAGAPAGTVGCLTIPSLDGCRELMTAPEVKLILATGGPAMVRSAYSSGKPAIGVGAGNGPAYIHRSADVADAIRKIVESKTFDNGTVCASEQSIIVERDMEESVCREARTQGCYFMTKEEADRLAACLFLPSGSLNPKIVGWDARTLARIANISAPEGTRVLVAREERVGAKYPYSMEKLCPVLAFYVVADENAVLERVTAVLNHEGSGHTFSIHATDERVIRRFAAKVPVSRFLVNTPAALGGIGATTELFPALTLGCGAAGGSSTSNNVSPLDLVNIRRVAWDTESAASSPEATANDALVERLADMIRQRLERDDPQ